ncbi:SPFH domain-containing protein [Candidatus Margulisiibacteriota bacterium]
MIFTLILGIFIILLLFIFSTSLRIVPQRTNFIIERLGKFHGVLEAGFHILIPFVDKVAYTLSLKEQAIDVPSQVCITRDNISVEVDGILYLQIMDPHKASYGIDNYLFASMQIAQTTMRSIIGTMALDQTFEEREKMNAVIVEAVDKASDPWGVKVTRYEVRDIKPPQSIKDAMEKQMRAEREKRALIAESEGDKQAKINRAEGDKRELIARSEGEKQKRINEAEGQAFEIEAVAKATALGIKEIANSIGEKKGMEAVNLRVAEKYILEFGNLAKKNNTMIIPSNMADLASLVATASSVIKGVKEPKETKDSIKPKP